MVDTLIIRKTLRVPAGDGAAVARQLDAALLSVGFTASRQLLEHVAGLEPGVAMDLAVRVLGAVRELVGDHVGDVHDDGARGRRGSNCLARW